MGRFAVVAVVLVTLATGFAPPASAVPAAVVTYRPPVDAPVVDEFRPPPENWNAGNRGIEYATRPGTPVGASATGEVVFAGPVAGELHVVVLHEDGIRTSYSFLASIAVHRGDKVRQGDTVGTTAARFHFGARAGDAYLDPALLFGGGPPEVHLVPNEQRRPGTEAQERSGLHRALGRLGARVLAGGGAAAEWVRDRGVEVVGNTIAEAVDEARGALHYAAEADPLTHLARFVRAADVWRKARDTCTPAAVPAPKLAERHILVLVGGLGSSSNGNAIDHLDAASLGYAKPDVLRYSYRGGTTKDHSYVPADTTTDIRESGRVLRDLLAWIEAEHPGVPVDIVAHSQGGLVARSALTDEADPTDKRLPTVNSLVTLGTPHLGTPAATGLTMVGHTTVGEVALAGVNALLPDMVAPAGASVTQIAEHSTFLRRLNDRPLPAGVRVTSIGAREDLLVPAGRTLLADANNVIVSVPGHGDDHGGLPGSAQAQREVALGLAGMDPTCQRLGDAVADAVVSELIYSAENGIGGGAWLAARAVDRRVGEAVPSPSVPRRSDLASPR